MSNFSLRPMHDDDLDTVRVLQSQSPEAAQWAPSEYLAHESFVVEAAGQVVGFLVLQVLGSDEAEILNLVVAPKWRRSGAARGLLLAAAGRRTLFLEVRESNAAALAFYRSLSFAETGRRPGYYQNPPEDAILMTRIAS